ncbi:MAG: DNA helicase UvrD, partial [Candidatus Electrothrix sp. ATG1]|nr:DNA helicase UvrD [Candidatus Electrothrix sp. ATG1]
MPYIADLHIHSLYSRATSKASNLHGLAAWAAIKGIDLVATGDFTHPGR